MASEAGPPAHEVPVEQARAGHAAETEHLAGEGVAVARVCDDTVADVPVRLYEPDGASGTVVYLHGGGWVLGNLDSVDAVCRALANESGTRVVSVDYRLAPEHPFPAGLQDALNVTRALEADVVAGDSAGGNLAAVLARELREQLKLQLLIYPVTDAGVNTPSYAEFDGRYGLTAASMQRFWGLYLDGADGLQPAASPLRGELEGPPAGVRHHRQPRCPARRGRGLRQRPRARRRAGHAATRRGRDPRLLALADHGDRTRRRARGGRRGPLHARLTRHGLLAPVR